MAGEYDVSLWKVKDDGVVIGQVLTFERSLERKKVVTYSMSNARYTQTTGLPNHIASVKIFCTEAERRALNMAEAHDDILLIRYKDTNYSGQIDEPPEWSTVSPGEYYEATVRFWIIGMGNAGGID